MKKKVLKSRKKIAAVTQGKKNSGTVNGNPLDRSLTDMRIFFHSQDWASLWEQFYLSLNPDATYKYRTVKMFVNEIAESIEQVKFLTWYLGPPMFVNISDDPDVKTYPFVPNGPVDWVDRRKNGGWFHERNMRTFSAEITRRMNALDALRESGNRFALTFLTRAHQLAQRLDEQFKGAFFVPGLTFAENEARADLYLRFHERLIRYYSKAQDLYAKSHGINFEDMAGLMQIMQATALSAAAQSAAGGELTREQAAIKQLMEMTLAKAARYQLPLPADAEAKILEVAAEAENDAPVSPKSKKNVQ